MKNDTRVEKVFELLIAGLSRHQIIQWAAEKGKWKVSERTLDRMISKAAALFEQEAKPIRQRELGKSIRRLDLLFSRCLQVQDFKTCLAVERQREELLALALPPEPEEVDKEKIVTIEFGDAAYRDKPPPTVPFSSALVEVQGIKAKEKSA